MKKQTISITVPKKEKSDVKRPTTILVFLLFGVLGLMIYLDSIGGVDFSFLLYPLSLLICSVLWYIYFYFPKLTAPFLILTAAVLLIIGLFKYREIYSQAMALGNAILGERKKVTLTLLCFVISLLIVFTLFFIEIAFNNHIILYLVTSFFLISAPVFGYDVSAASYVLLFAFQIAFFAVYAAGASRKKTLTPKKAVYKNASKAAVICTVSAVIILSALFFPVKHLQDKLYEAVYSAEGFVKDTVNSLASYTLSPYENGSISKGNLYTSGNTTLIVSAQNIPSDTVYLKSYIGDEYKNSDWSKADDNKIIEEIINKHDWAETYGYEEYVMADCIKQIPWFYNDHFVSNYITVKRQFNEDINEYVPYFSTVSYATLVRDINDASGYDFFSISDIDPEYFKSELASSYSFTITDGTDELYTTIDLDSSLYTEFIDDYKRYSNDRFIKYDRNNTPKLSEYCEEHPLSKLDEITTFIAYTLQSNTKYNKTPGMAKMSSDVVDDFLFNRRQGYCVHYASTAALMYRMYGIPARFVSGYSVSPDKFKDLSSALSSSIDEYGNPVSIDMYTPFSAELTDEDAHAWVEIFLDGYGWVPVEFTPDSNGNIMPYYPSFTDTTFNDILNEKGWKLDVPSIPIETSDTLNSNTGSSFFGLSHSISIALIVILAVILTICFMLMRRSIIQKHLRKIAPKKMFTRLVSMLDFTKSYDDPYNEEKLAERLYSYYSKPPADLNSNIKVTYDELDTMEAIYNEAAFGPKEISADKKRFLLIMYKKLALISYQREKSRIKRLIFKYVKSYI